MADTDITRHKLWRISRIYDIALVNLILLNVLAVILETMDGLSTKYAIGFKWFEIISTLIFTVEYVLRLWSCVSEEGHKKPLIGRLKFIATPLSIFDLLSILPFYIPLFFAADLGMLRLFRLFRIFKIARYIESLKKITLVLRQKKAELCTSFGIMVFLLIFASSVLYCVENSAQPDAFSSIPAAMWWGVATLTTVGYGDIYPITILGKCAAALFSIIGIGAFGLPAGILASGLMQLSGESQ